MNSFVRRTVWLCGAGVLVGVLGAGWLYGQAKDPREEIVRLARAAGIVLEPEPHLEGTTLLKLPEGIARPTGMNYPKQGAIFVEQLRQANEYFLRRIAGTQEERDRNWTPDFGSTEKYQASLAEHRKNLRRMLGLRKDAGAGIEVERRKLGDGVEEVRLRLEEGLEGEGLVFFPKGKVVGTVIAIPDEDELRERFAGLLAGEEAAGWLKDLLGGGLVVCVPRTVERKTDYAYGQRTQIDQRLLLHRLGFIVGRTLVGLEVEQVLGFKDYLEKRLGNGRVAVMGLRQGGMTALYAGAAEGGFKAVAAVDYFEQREGCWREPADRMLYGQLKEFGDGELGALIAPARLEVVYTQGGPTPRESVEREGRRARRFYEGLGEGQKLRIEGVSGVEEGLEKAAGRIKEVLGKGKGGEEEVGVRLSEAEAKQGAKEQFERWHEFLRGRDKASDEERRRRWALLETPEGEREAKAAALRKKLGAFVGTVQVDGPLNPRTRLLKVTDKFVAYEVLLDVVKGVESYGQLLVPRGERERWPAVICQHGLGGTPADITGIGTDSDPVYHALGAHLGGLGYVVFAPYINVPIRQEVLVNPLVRQAAALGMMRTSLELAKLHRVVDFLQSLPFVDAERIGYYGLSYGGYSAIWMPPLEPRLKASVISGHFNDWRRKLTAEDEETSYLRYQDADFYNWDVLERFTHLELVAAMYPRPVCVEYGDRDGTTTPEWHARTWQEVERWKEAWGLGGLVEKVARVRYQGVHEIHGVGTINFLDRWLRPQLPDGRDYAPDLIPKYVELLTFNGKQAPDGGVDSEASLAQHGLDSNPRTRIEGRFYVSNLHPVFSGFELQLSRTGQPGDLLVRFGSTPGGHDLGEARLSPREVNPLFSFWYSLKISPIRLDPSKLYYFDITTSGGNLPHGGFFVYGPPPLGGTDEPRHFGLSYRVLAEGETRTAGQPYERFGFMKSLLGSYTGGPPVVTAGFPVRTSGEVEVTTDWSILPDRRSDEVSEAAADDLLKFFQTAFNLNLKTSPKESRPVIRLRVVPRVKGVNTVEGYRITARSREITIEGTTARGVMRGVYGLEEQMRTRHKPCVEKGTRALNARFGTRITTAVHPQGIIDNEASFPLSSQGSLYNEASFPLPYTDGLLQRISHSGFNAVWVWLNTEEATLDSRIYPEFNDPEAATRLQRLEDLARRARRYGVDVYIYFATGYDHHISEGFFRKHPDARGYGWGPPLCTSNEEVRRYYAETVKTIFRKAPDLKGMVVIYDSEGFWYCGNSEQTLKECPRCRHFTQEAVAAQLLTTLDTAMHEAGGAEKTIIAWNYNRASSWVTKLFPLLPKDIIIQGDFDKGMMAEKDGIRHQTEDYNISNLGPPELFVREYEAARVAGLKVAAKTEHAVSQEFIFVPYIPCLDQWYRRAAKMRDFDLAGWFGNWNHYGYTPSRPALLLNRMSFSPAPPEDTLLEELAVRDFGAEAAPYVTRAWADFSQGIRAYPYSDPVARTPGPVQRGPSQPLFLDPTIGGFGSWRSWQNDLKWTDPWGPRITAKYLGSLLEWYGKGNAEIEAALLAAPEAYRPALLAEWRKGRTIYASVQTVLNLMEWIETRDRLLAARSKTERAELAQKLEAIALAERSNAEMIVPILRSDSSLGYAASAGAGGLFAPALVQWKIGFLDDVLLRQMPEFLKHSEAEP